MWNMRRKLRSNRKSKGLTTGVKLTKLTKLTKKLTPYAVYYAGCDTMDRIRKKFTSGSHNSK